MSQTKVPQGFTAVVFTMPHEIDSDSVPRLKRLAKDFGVENLPGMRVFHCAQVREVDSAAVAELLETIKEVEQRSGEVFVCDPPRLLLNYFDLYDVESMLEKRIVVADDDGQYRGHGADFLPPFVPHEKGRVDVWNEGKVESYEYGADSLVKVAPVNFKDTRRVYAEAPSIVVEKTEKRETSVMARAFALVRRYRNEPDPVVGALRKLHKWYRLNAEGISQVSIWVDEADPNQVSEHIVFRDKRAFEGFHDEIEHHDERPATPSALAVQQFCVF